MKRPLAEADDELGEVVGDFSVGFEGVVAVGVLVVPNSDDATLTADQALVVLLAILFAENCEIDGFAGSRDLPTPHLGDAVVLQVDDVNGDVLVGGRLDKINRSSLAAGYSVFVVVVEADAAKLVDVNPAGDIGVGHPVHQREVAGAVS